MTSMHSFWVFHLPATTKTVSTHLPSPFYGYKYSSLPVSSAILMFNLIFFRYYHFISSSFFLLHNSIASTILTHHHDSLLCTNSTNSTGWIFNDQRSVTNYTEAHILYPSTTCQHRPLNITTTTTTAIILAIPQILTATLGLLAQTNHSHHIKLNICTPIVVFVLIFWYIV